MSNGPINASNNGVEYLASIAMGSDCLDVDPRGILCVDGVPADRLIADFGSPLFVVSESTVRQNVRAARRAFSVRWPAPVNVMYAIKANNNLAIRAIVHAEGGGGDCFGMGELYATFQGGADPALIAMNGTYKTPQEIDEAVRRGVTINIDAEDEVELICVAARKYNVRAQVNIRIKVFSDYFRDVGSDYFGVPDHIGVRSSMETAKWGFGIEKAAALTRRLADLSDVDHAGFHWHFGRFSTRKDAIAELYSALGKTVSELHERTGFWPRILDIGGGIPRERDPESRQLAMNQLNIDGYAETVCSALLKGLSHSGLPTPALWLEPGRFIVGNASILLTTIGTIKRDLGYSWVNVDSSTNLLMRIDTSDSRYHIVPASCMRRPFKEGVSIVGLTCIPSVFARSQDMPGLAAGEILAILDAGMYSEVTSTQFNGVPRPATVLVNDGHAEVIKTRETIEDVFRLHRIPERLLAN